MKKPVSAKHTEKNIESAKSLDTSKNPDEPKEKTFNSTVHQKKWGERQSSWKTLQFESVQALVDKGWSDAEKLKDKRKPSPAKKPQAKDQKEAEEEKKVEKIVAEAVVKAEEIKQQKEEERKQLAQKRAKSRGAVGEKPKWNERKTSWKAADFDSVQALIEQAWKQKELGDGEDEKKK